MKQPVPLVQLIHWKAEEIPERAKLLREAGYRVRSESADGKDAIKGIAASAPVAIVIDLSRLPAHGRTTGFVLRQQKATRAIPLVFMGGAPDKVATVRELLPDAVYSQWTRTKSALKKAIALPAAGFVVPKSNSGGYSGTPLPKKLGIKEKSSLALFNAPEGFDRTLGDLPPGVMVKRGGSTPADLLIVFVRSVAELRKGIKMLKSRKDESPAWIAWPKKTSPLAGDVSETEVRAEGLAAGMVDFKVCAIDADWSGLKFSRKRK